MLRHLIAIGRTSGMVLAIGLCCGAGAGAAGTAFSLALSVAAKQREAHPLRLGWLPLGGFVLGLLLERWGRDAAQGTQRLAHAWAGSEPRLPWPMAWWVFVTSVGTHALGGSAGREGAAVQLGASVAESLAAACFSASAWRRSVLVAGMAGALAAVFGTPVAAVLFALEWLEGHVLASPTLLCTGLVAAYVGRQIACWLGVEHATFLPTPLGSWTPVPWGSCLVLAVASAAAATLFVHTLEALRRLLSTWVPKRSVRMALGGSVLLCLSLGGGRAYLGLGEALLARSFVDPTLSPWAAAYKGLWTVVTLGAGFTGGEVTPLFCMGAALGNALSGPLALPLWMSASLGMFAVFAAAAKTPVSLAIMAAEVFGLKALLPALFVHTAACALRGRSPSLYADARRIAQRAQKPSSKPSGPGGQAS